MSTRARIIWRLIQPDGRWMCGVAAMVIAVVRLLAATSLSGNLVNDGAYGAWFGLASLGLLVTAERPWHVSARIVAAVAAGAFVMLAVDVVARSVTSGLIPIICAYRLAWESLRCWQL